MKKLDIDNLTLKEAMQIVLREEDLVIEDSGDFMDLLTACFWEMLSCYLEVSHAK